MFKKSHPTTLFIVIALVKFRLGNILFALGIFAAATLGFTPGLSAQAPDLTAGGTPTSSLYWNMGSTGMNGWFYHVGTKTDDSRQILVKTVDAGSPGDGILAIDDVVLGANGTGAEPLLFSYDARKELADAIGEAEARDPAILKLLRWRAGVTTTVSITLEYLGAYSATAPYDCPKSAAILEKGLNKIMLDGGTDDFNFSRAVTLMAANDPTHPDNAARQAKARDDVLALNLTQDEIDEYISGKVLTTSKIAWSLGFKLVTQAEYFLQTGDTDVLPSIRARAIAYANGQSMFGTAGHQFAKQLEDGSVNGPYGIGYGVVNSANMQCFYGLVLAKQCGVNDPEIDPAIARASRFYGSYVNRGSIPYGEHGPGGGWESNGKMGIAALIFDRKGNSAVEKEYYARMAAASFNQRDAGHTGPYLNYLWAPLGANVGGKEALTAFFQETRWMYDLARRWDGSFEYNTYGQGNNGGPDWSGSNFQMSAAVLLTYAAPLRQLHMTGKGQDSLEWLSTAEVDDVKFSANYDPTTRTTSELLDNLDSWAPPVRQKAAVEIGTRTAEHGTLLPTLHDMANNPAGGNSRIGACHALREIAADSSASVLANLLTDSDHLVRWASADALRYLSDSAQMGVIDTILAAADSTSQPLLPLDEEDPLHLAHANIAGLLFHNGGAGSPGGPSGVLYQHDLVGIDRDLLYPAIRAVAENPLGGPRSTLSHIYPYLNEADLEAVAGAVVDSTRYEAEADRMFSAPIRTGGVNLLQRFYKSEGVPLAIKASLEMRAVNDTTSILGELEEYAGSGTLVKPDPKVVEFCEFLIASGQFPTEARAILDAIEADQLPTEVTPFKSVDWIFPDDASFDLPKKSTVLRVQSTDHAKGDSIYTWRKVHGAGEVSFIPNGTAAAKDTTVVFDGVPGEYKFEVTMSDSRDLTETTNTVTVTLRQSDGTLPANAPPTADAQSITVGQGTPTQVILTGSDPEDYALSYTVTSEPTYGTLSGTAPSLVYTAKANYTGLDAFTFEVLDSEGQVASATVSITVDPVIDVGVAVYEPFDYPAGLLDGISGVNEVGLTGSWTADASIKVVADSPPFGTLITAGGSIGDLDTNGSFGGTRTLDAAALAGNGLLDDGATLWFSAVLGPHDSTWQRRLFVALANNQFNSNTNNLSIVDDGAQLGSGIGFTMEMSTVLATQYRDASFGTTQADNHVSGDWDNHQGTIGSGERRLVVGRITWGATTDTIEIFMPYDDMQLPSKPSSKLLVSVDQSTFDTLTFSRGSDVILDEIRFGATYQSVLQGTVAMTEDITPPTPDPMSFAAAPYVSGASSITMEATPAHDDMAVEYYFTNTAGGGNDSGWQSSRVYTDTGLSTDVTYSYTVKARDQLPGDNRTQPSPVASATIPALATVPNVVGMPQSSGEAWIVDQGFAVGAVTDALTYSLDVPAGHVLTQSPSGDASAAYGSAVDLEISIGQDPALPTLDPVAIVDDQSGGPVETNSLLIYTLTFSEDMDAGTVDAADFTNASDAAISIGTINETSAGVFTVEVTPTTTGTLRFAVAAGAALQDAGGDALNTTNAIIDDTVITVNLPPEIVPDMVGMTQANAETTITTANLTVGNIFEIYDETVAAGDVISSDPAAGASVPGQSPVDLVLSLGPPPDTTGPVITETAPAHGELHVEVDSKLVVYFDEDIFPASGNITLRNLNDYTESGISIIDDTQVSISGVVLTITPDQPLEAGKTYAVRIGYGTVEDAAGNPFQGIDNNEIWNFSTAFTSNETVLFTEDFESPDVAGYSEGSTPPDWVRADRGFNSDKHGLNDKGSGDFSAADPNHQGYSFRAGNAGITTAEGVITALQEGLTYEVEFDVIRDDSNGGLNYKARMVAFATGAARNDARSENTTGATLLTSLTGDAPDNGSFYTVSFQYTVPAGSAVIGQDLAVRFQGGAIIDNVVVKTVVAGLTDDYSPVATTFTPEFDATSVEVIDNMVVNFNKTINRGTGEITLRNLSNGTEIKIDMLDGNQVFLNGSELTINPADNLLVDTFYAVLIPATAVYDANGNFFAGIDSDKTWRFYTGEITDTAAPLLQSLDPLDGAAGVAWDSDLVMTFNESVSTDIGSITLKNLTDSTATVIDVTDTSQVSYNGPDVTIHPTDNLVEGADYAIQVDAGAIVDLPGIPHAGILDDTIWNFTVSATNPPQAIAFDPADGLVDVASGAALNVTFDKDMAVATGNITLKNLTDATDTVIDVTEGGQVSISGDTVTIQPTGGLADASQYAVLIDSGALTDLSSNAFAGISDTTVWNFTTAPSAFGMVFFDDFEVASGSPNVDATDSTGSTSKETGPNWVRSNQGFGSDKHGTVDESSALFTDPTGEQAYAFRSGNTGLTTVEGVIGTLATDETYTVSFHVVMDGYTDGNSYQLKLLTFAPGAARNEARNDSDASSVLQTVSGNYSGTDYKLITLEYTSNGTTDGSEQGHDLALRFIGSGTSTIIDNVQVNVTGGSDDDIAPTLASADIVDDLNGDPAGVGLTVNFAVTFSEAMHAATVTAEDFSTAGTAAVTIGTVSQIAPKTFEVPVTPDTTGTLQLRVNAAAILTDLAGNLLDTSTAIADDTVITVNSTTTVPDVVGLAQATAESNIQAAGLVVGTITNEYHPSVPVGDVISQDPVGAITAADGSAVDLVVSLGSLDVTVTFDPNGGTTPNPTSKVVTNGLTYGSLPTTGQAGYTFKGWFTAAVDGNLVESTTEVTATADHTLYAQWNTLPTVNAGADDSVLLVEELWTPAQMATVAWYDASDANTITASSGAVSQWDDKSGNGNHLSQATETDRPTTGTQSIGGLNAVVFADDFMLSAASVSTARAVFFVSDNLAGSSTSTNIAPIFGEITSSQSYTFVRTNDLTYSISIDGNTGLTGAASVSGNPLVAGTDIDLGVTNTQEEAPLLWHAQYDATVTFDFLGFLESNNPFTLQGNIGEFIILDSVPTIEERQKIEGYLAWKWGLEGNLPLDHPYKDAAPGAATANASLNGTASDADGDTLVTTWSQVDGPANATFTDASLLDSGVTFTAAGTYTLRLTANDGTDEVSDDMLFTVDQAYAVNYDANGADSGTVTASQVKEQNVDLTLATNSGNLARNGYDFVGWNTSPDGIGTDYAEGAVYSLNEALKLFAKWSLQGFLEVVPADDLASEGDPGGPFSPSSVNYTLQNIGNSEINWTAGNTAAWVSLSATSGTLAPGASTTVTVSINSGADSLAPGNYSDTVSFTNTSNGNGDSARAVSLKVSTVPVADDQAVSCDEDTSLAVTLTASDADGDPLSYSVTTAPSFGALTGTAPNLTYTPDPDFNGSDSFTFVANDGTVDSNTATVSIIVNAINDAPVFIADPFSAGDAVEDLAYSDHIGDAATDVDGDSLTYAKVSGPTWLSVASDGTLSGTPLLEDVGSNSFVVSASDGAATIQATLNIEVAAALLVTFDANGGTAPDPASKKVGNGLTYGTLATTGRADYSFKGWFTAASGGNLVASDTEVTATSDHTLYAQWNELPTVNAGADDTVLLVKQPEWTPAEITTVAWFDAQDTATITETSGMVSQWDDKSGNGNHLTNGSGASQPPFNASDALMNSMPTIGNSAATSTYLDSTASINVKKAYTVTYYNNTTFDNWDVLLTSLTDASGTRTGGRSGENFLASPGVATVHKDGFPVTNYADSNTIAPLSASILVTTFDATITDTWRVLANKNSAWGHWSRYGAVGEVILTDGTEDLATQQKIEGYLAWKWGLEANLPADHPHKDAPPGAATVRATLSGTASDPETDPLTTTWSMTSGPASMTFDDAAALDTNANFIEFGAYTLRLTANDGFGETYDELVVTVDAAYAVNYDANGADSGTAPDSQVKNEGVDLTLAINSGNLGKTGYDLLGWNTAAGGSGTDYAAGGTYTSDAPVTLYAKWGLSAPVADAGGGYHVSENESLALDASASQPSYGATITAYEWDLNNDGLYDEGVSGANPAAIPYDDLMGIHGMTVGSNTIRLRVTDSAALTDEITATVFLSGLTTHTANQSHFANDSWNLAGSWDKGIPSNTMDVAIAAGKQANVNSAATPVYTGSLQILNNATLKILGNDADINALGTETVTMGSGAWLRFRSSQTRVIDNPFELLGAVTMRAGESTAGSVNATFNGVFTGSYPITLEGNGSSRITFAAANAFTSVTTSLISSNSWDLNWEIRANATASLGTGDITMADTVSLVVNANDAIADAAALHLNGAPSNNVAAKLVMNADDTVDQLYIDGTQQASGAYTSAASWLSGTGTLTVISGPVDSFQINNMPAEATVGSEITGLSVTAWDANMNTATSFTGSVTFGGTAGDTGTSANFVDGVLNGLTVIPQVVGTGLTFTVDDGAGHTGSATFDVIAVYDEWSTTYGLSGTDAEPAAILQPDGFANLQKFAFGMDPAVAYFNPLEFVLGGELTAPGAPKLMNMAGPGQADDERAVFARLKKYAAAGLTYAVEFSADLKAWTASATPPTVLTDENSSQDHEVVSVPFPLSVPVQGGGSEQAPKFMRVVVSNE